MEGDIKHFQKGELEEHMVKGSVHFVFVGVISEWILSMIDREGKVSERREVRGGAACPGHWQGRYKIGIWRRWRRRRIYSRAKTVASK